MEPFELARLEAYCAFPGNEAVMVTEVFCVTVDAVNVTDVPVVEERLPVSTGLRDQVIS